MVTAEIVVIAHEGLVGVAVAIAAGVGQLRGVGIERHVAVPGIGGGILAPSLLRLAIVAVAAGQTGIEAFHPRHRPEQLALAVDNVVLEAVVAGIAAHLGEGVVGGVIIESQVVAGGDEGRTVVHAREHLIVARRQRGVGVTVDLNITIDGGADPQFRNHR